MKVDQEDDRSWVAEFDLEESIREIREDLRNRDGFENVKLRAIRRKNDKCAIRVYGARDDQRAAIKEVAREWQGLSYHETRRGWFANFVVEFSQEKGDAETEN